VCGCPNGLGGLRVTTKINYLRWVNIMMLIYYLSLLDTEDEKERFEQIYNIHRDLMFYAAKRILKDESLAEDAVHSAFLKIINHLDKIEDINCHKTKAFLVIVVENTAKDIYNKQKKYSLPLDSFETDLLFSQNFEESVIAQISLSELVNNIKSLPDIYEDILTMHFIYDLTYKEISKILKISEPNVRKRIQRARQLLLQKIGKELITK